MEKSNKYWEICWKEENAEELYQYLGQYHKCAMPEIEVFKEFKVKKVCDAACGFGAYSMAFASHGFDVCSFDISETAVAITKNGLERYGMDSSKVKVASIVDTKYAKETFDGIIVHAVLDHLTVGDARRALGELLRITKAGGILMFSFDTPEEEDFFAEHLMIEPGTMEYTDDSRKGMLFHPYEWDEIENLLQDHEVIYKTENSKKEKTIIIKK